MSRVSSLLGLVARQIGMPGAWRKEVIPRIMKERSDLPIVISSMQPDSHIPPCRSLRGMIAAGDHNPAKSRILLQLALACYGGSDWAKIRKAFGTDGGLVEVA